MPDIVHRALLKPQSDHQLVALAAAGSERAFEVLVQRHQRALLAQCRKLLLDGDAAQDAVQAALIAAWRALQQGREVREPRAWLVTIARREALRTLRSSGYDHAELHEGLHGGDLPETEIERRIVMRRTLAGIAALPPAQRDALLRTAVDGSSYADTAAALGVGEDAIRGLVHRARAALRTSVAAVLPWPLVMWAARDHVGNAPLTERVAELVTGAGAVAGTSLLAKGAATVAVTAAVAGGGLAAREALRQAPPPRASVTASPRADVPPRAAAPPAAARSAAPAVRLAPAPANGARRRAAPKPVKTGAPRSKAPVAPVEAQSKDRRRAATGRRQVGGPPAARGRKRSRRDTATTGRGQPRRAAPRRDRATPPARSVRPPRTGRPARDQAGTRPRPDRAPGPPTESGSRTPEKGPEAKGRPDR